MNVGRQIGVRTALLLFWALMLMVLLNFSGILFYLFFDTSGPGQVRMAWVLIGLCAISLALTTWRSLTKSLGLPGFLFLGALSSYLGIGIAVNIWNGVDFPTIPALRHGVYFMVVLATAAGTTTIARSIGVVRLLQWILVVLALGCISILITPWLVSTASADLFQRGLKMVGFYLQPNKAGRFAVMTAWLAFALILCKGNRALASFVLAIAVSAVATTVSRSAILALLGTVALFVVYWMALRPKITTNPISLLILAATLGGTALLIARSRMLLFMVGTLERKIPSLLSLLSGDVSVLMAEERWQITMLALQHVEAASLVGSGFREHHDLEGAYYCGVHLVGGEAGKCSAHNFYLTLWVEAGVVPVLLYLGYLLVMLGMSLGLPQRAATVTALGWTVVIAFHNLFSDNGFDNLWLGCFSGLTFGLLVLEMRRYWASRLPDRARPTVSGDPSLDP